MTSYQPLHEGWQLSGGELSGVPATVPGCVHTDLLAAGLIDDPYRAWIGRTDWTYETTFTHRPAGERTDLVCAGLDTVATVTLNGVELGRTANMHRCYRFPTGDALRSGANRLSIRFASAYAYAEAVRDRLGDRPRPHPDPFPFVRRMAGPAGGDPAPVTAGIWQQIGLETWSVAHLAEVRPHVTVTGAIGRVELSVRLDRSTTGLTEPVTVTATVAGERAVAVLTGTDAELVMTVDDPLLWWPRGYGDQYRYDLDVTLLDSRGAPLDAWSRRIGFRSVRLGTDPGDPAAPYPLVVNRTPIFVRGATWVPDHTFVSRITRRRLATRLRQAADANINYLRVWGGGRYESDDFYDLADETGLMVGQDFLLSCAAYPEEEPIAGEVAAEAGENVVRLASHPSLVLWSGPDGPGAGGYAAVLRSIVAGTDPGRPYRPVAPHPAGRTAPPAYATLTESATHPPFPATHPPVPASGSPGHPPVPASGSPGHPPVSASGLADHLPPPRDFDDWHYLAQLDQVRTVAAELEAARSQRPHRLGAMLDQLNDPRPVASAAAIDGAGRRRPLWHAVRRAYADRLLTVQPRDGGPVAVAVNDGIAPWSAEITVSRLTLAGVVLAETVLRPVVAPGAAVTLPLPSTVFTPGDPAAEVMLAEAAGGHRAWWFFADDRDVRWPLAKFDTRVERIGDVTTVTVIAQNILRSLILAPDRLHPAAEVDDADVTLLPGESTTFTVRGATGLDPVALTSRPVLRCVNDRDQSPIR